jgi:hypothetical protein
MHGGENDHHNLRGKQSENDLERIDQKGEYALENVEKTAEVVGDEVYEVLPSCRPGSGA